MSAEGKKLAIGVCCADWRLHQKSVNIVEKVRAHLGVEGVDVVALPGPDGICVQEGREGEIAPLTSWLKILLDAHKPALIAFIGHYQCAGNPVDDATHDKNVEETMRYFRERVDFSGEMVALTATYTSDTEWGLKEVARA